MFIMTALLERAPERQLSSELVQAIGTLPTIAMLPSRRALNELQDSGTRAITGPITVKMLIDHLARAKSCTPEIGIGYYGVDTYTLDIGNPDHVTENGSWDNAGQQAAVYLHTHPDPKQARRMWCPSLPDIEIAQASEAVELIGSNRGLTVIPKLTVHIAPATLWDEYAADNQKPDYFGFNWEGENTCYEAFIRDVVCPEFISWPEIDPRLTIAEVVNEVI
jgi:hypothetical protein